MPWTVSFADAVEPAFDEPDEQVQDAILVRVLLLEREGPSLGPMSGSTAIWQK